MTKPDKIKVAVKSDEICLRDPVSRERITTEGKVVRRSAFWLRRIKDGDVVLLPIEPKKDEPKENLELEGVDNVDTV